MLCLPAELRNAIYKFASEKFVYDRSYKMPYQHTRSRVPLLSTCRQIRDEASDMNDESHILRMDPETSPYWLHWASKSRYPWRKHVMNEKIYTLEISRDFFQNAGYWTRITSIFFRLRRMSPERLGDDWLRELFPNLSRVEVYEYVDLSSDDRVIRGFREYCLGGAAGAGVEVVLGRPLALGPCEEVG